MQHRQILRNEHVVMHWGAGYPDMNDVWLAYFRGSERLFLCRVEHSDQMGGNLVELHLQRADAEEPRRFRDVVRYRFIGGETSGIVAWEPLTWIREENWYDFLDGKFEPEVMQAVRERLQKPPQPVPDGRGGYTKGTIAYSLSREYEGP